MKKILILCSSILISMLPIELATEGLKNQDAVIVTAVLTIVGIIALLLTLAFAPTSKKDRNFNNPRNW